MNQSRVGRAWARSVSLALVLSLGSAVAWVAPARAATPPAFTAGPSVDFGAPWSGDPAVLLISDSTPTLTATVTDADSANVEVCFILETEQGGSFTPVGEPLCTTIPGSPSGWPLRRVVPEPLPGDGRYYLRATADDGAAVVETGRVGLLLDSTPPAAPSLQLTPPAGGWVQGGAPGELTLTGPPDAVEFAWSMPFGDPGVYCGAPSPYPSVPAIPAGDATTATVSLTSGLAGPSTLAVVACDEAHNRSASVTESFFTRPPVASHVWTFADDAELPGRDTGEQARNATRLADRGGAGRAEGRDTAPDRSLLLAGDGHARTPAAGSLVSTSGGFSVVAWVSGVPGARARGTVLAQSGTITDSVRLSVGADRYRAVVRGADDQGSVKVAVALGFAGSGCAPTATRWCLVAGTWSAASHTLSLMSLDPTTFDSAASSSAPRPEVTPFTATRRFRAGVAKTAGRSTDRFTGRIDELRVYDGVLSQSDVRTLGIALR